MGIELYLIFQSSEMHLALLQWHWPSVWRTCSRSLQCKISVCQWYF